jgi:hypothetical protein
MLYPSVSDKSCETNSRRRIGSRPNSRILNSAGVASVSSEYVSCSSRLATKNAGRRDSLVRPPVGHRREHLLNPRFRIKRRIEPFNHDPNIRTIVMYLAPRAPAAAGDLVNGFRRDWIGPKSPCSIFSVHLYGLRASRRASSALCRIDGNGSVELFTSFSQAG